MGLSVKNEEAFAPGAAGALQLAVTEIDADAVSLGGKPQVVVICHPHPEQGGTMENKVVTTLMRTYRDLGVTSVRFNFRGVGASEGLYDSGLGEVEDVLAVCAWAEKRWPEAQLLLAGFSFGAAMAAQASYQLAQLQHLLLIAPPVMRYAFSKDRCFGVPVTVVQGSDDAIVPAGVVGDWVRGLTGDVVYEVLPGADHFFTGALSPLKSVVTARLRQQLGAQHP